MGKRSPAPNETLHLIKIKFIIMIVSFYSFQSYSYIRYARLLHLLQKPLEIRIE